MLLLAFLFAMMTAAPLPPYTEAIRCAGLAEASYELATSKYRKAQMFDASVFWGLTASERARKDGVSAAAFGDDQVRARRLASAELRRGNASSELESCVRRVPAAGKRG